MNLGGLDSFRKGMFKVPLYLVRLAEQIKENSTFFRKKKTNPQPLVNGKSGDKKSPDTNATPNISSVPIKPDKTYINGKPHSSAFDRELELEARPRREFKKSPSYVHRTDVNHSIDDDPANNSNYYPPTARDSREPPSRKRNTKNLEALVSSRPRLPFSKDAAAPNFKEEREDLTLKLKGFNTVQDDGYKFLVGEYEKVAKGSEHFEENISTRDKNGEVETPPSLEPGVEVNNEPIAIDVNHANEIKSYGDGGICSICFTFEPDAVYMNCGHGGRPA